MEQLKNKFTSGLENKTVDKIIKPDDKTSEQLYEELFSDDFYSDDFCDSLKEKLEKENKEREEREEEQALEDEKGDSELPFKEPEDKNLNLNTIPKVKAEIIKADEIKPELVEFITNTVVEKIQAEKKGKLLEIIQGRVITQEEWYKLILWKYFPVIGVPIYLMLLLLLSLNKTGKYDPTLVNFARAEIKTFWIYLLVHIIVVFTCCMAVISLINIIQRGLMA